MLPDRLPLVPNPLNYLDNGKTIEGEEIGLQLDNTTFGQIIDISAGSLGAEGYGDVIYHQDLERLASLREKGT